MKFITNTDMKLPIYLYGSEVLKEPAKEADLNDREMLMTLVEDMKETLASADGCGLVRASFGDRADRGHRRFRYGTAVDVGYDPR